MTIMLIKAHAFEGLPNVPEIDLEIDLQVEVIKMEQPMLRSVFRTAFEFLYDTDITINFKQKR